MPARVTRRLWARSRRLARQGELTPGPRYHKDSCRNVWPKHTPLRGNAENCVRCAVARIAAASLNNQEKPFAKEPARSGLFLFAVNLNVLNQWIVETDQELIEFVRSSLFTRFELSGYPHPPTPLAARLVKKRPPPPGSGLFILVPRSPLAPSSRGYPKSYRELCACKGQSGAVG